MDVLGNTGGISDLGYAPGFCQKGEAHTLTHARWTTGIRVDLWEAERLVI